VPPVANVRELSGRTFSIKQIEYDMNKYLTMAAAAVLALLAAGCNKNVAPAEETAVSFTLETPEIATKAVADGQSVTQVRCIVYRDGRLIRHDDVTKVIPMSAGKATYETRLIKLADANHRPLGSVETCNKRTINQFIHPDVLKTCQLSMGMTELDAGSNWNTMPSHTHERRMEVYTYFEVPEGQVVFHMCGEPTQTRHIVMHNEDAVISPSWSIHSGVGTSNYSFIWAMGGENQEFDDMNNIENTDLR